MQRIYGVRSKGQVLVLVALALFVLVGFTALAVDGGNVYATRRKMQNAADAGALAGARQLCFEPDNSFTAVQAVAQEYAITHNLAEVAEVAVTNLYTVTVVARTTADTFFAGAIGFRDVPVSARASARCTQSVVGGDIFPLAIKLDAYTEDLACDEYFYAFVTDTSGNKIYCWNEDQGDIPEDYEICDCSLPFAGSDGTSVTGNIGSGERGWLSLFEPEPPWLPENKYNPDCGANDLKYWIVNSHPGPVVYNMCLPGKAGVTQSAEKPVDSIAGEIRNLVLFDTSCPGCNPYYNCCSNPGSAEDFYRVAGFGCVEVVSWETVQFPLTFADGFCKKVDVIIMRKACGEECEALSGSGTGDPDPDAVRSVVLVE